MAIIVEEEKSRVGIMAVFMWFVVLIIVAVGVYYIFFVKPQIVDVAVPSNFENINPIAEININPEDVINSSGFQSLKQYVTPPVPGNAGRANPFVAP